MLPSDGSGPWIPGSAADQNPPTPVPAALPPTGGRQDAQPWGQPQQPQQPHQAYGQDPHAPHAPYGAQGTPQDPAQGYGAPGGSPSYDQPYQQPYPQGGQEPYGAYGAPEPTPSYGRPGGAPYDATPPQQQPYGQPAPQPQAQPLPQPYGESPQYSEPQPYPGSPQSQGYGDPAGQAQPPQQGGYGQPMPLPAEAPPPGSADATQYLPPIPAAPPGAGDSDATQFIPPVPPASPGSRGPGVLPPESRDNGSDATQFLPPVAAQGSDAEATQFIAPVPAGPPPAAAGPAPYGVRPGAPGDRPPPAEFDNLFRTDGPSSGSTQKMPRIETPAPPVGSRRSRGGGAGQQPRQQPPAPSYGNSPSYGDQAAPGGHAPHEPRGRSAGRRTSSRVPLIATVTAGIVVLGLGAGALMSGGGDDAPKDDSKTVAAASSPSATESAAQAAPDPVKTQATELDKLLADSSSSRESVINAVNSIRTCDNLGQAATDLHAAAEQRRGLVTRLDALTVDKLPQHTELTSSLTDAWEASASADDHYAAWAKQVGKKKGCKDGQARVTSERSKGDRASGEATAAKKKASGLWNGIATKYGLTERAPTQL
ncbi:hypothetical protein [Streptomyces sp. NPDC059134]|uniref:hypothetical protein n=1 Tax=Streptomyces sp. NPDC059134 TaxID=3346738 RepID=UPI0036A6C71A